MKDNLYIINKLRPKKLFSKLMLSYLVIIFLTLIILGGIMVYLLERHFYGAREWEINSQAQKAASILEEPLLDNNTAEIFDKTNTLSKSFESNIEVYDSNGTKLTKSSYQDEPENGEITSENLETQGDEVNIEKNEKEYVLMGNSFTKKIHGPHAERLLVAIPITEEQNPGNKADVQKVQNDEKEKVVGFVTFNAPLKGLEDTLASIFRITLTSGGIALFFAIIFAFSLSRNITKPLKTISKSAKELANGNYQQVGVETISENEDELSKMSKTFDLAANQIDKTIKEQKKLAVYRKNLVDNASHEFRGPLSTIRGYCELLIDDILPRDKQKKYLNIIMQNTLNLNKMVDELMELSSLESGKIKLKKEKLSAVQVARQNYENILPLANEKDQEVTLDIKHPENEIGYFQGDITRLNQVLHNLLKNAVQFTGKNGKITLRVSKDLTNKNILFEIKDNGKGIPEEEVPNIFHRFYKLDKSRNDSSKTGLGLAIAYELVKLHNGEITVESKPDKGSTFKVIFPRT